MVIQIDPALRGIRGQRTENNTAEGWSRSSRTDHDRPIGPRRAAAKRRHAAVLAATVAGVLSIVGTGAGAQTVFAAEGLPGEAAAGQIAAAEASCLANLTESTAPTTGLAEWEATHSAEAAARRKAVKGRGSRKRRGRHGVGHRAAVESAAHLQDGGWRVVVAKAEGPYTTVLATDGSAQASGTCLTGPGSSQPVIGTGMGGGGEGDAVPPAGKIGGSGFGGRRAPDEQFLNDAAGRVGAGVSAVNVVLIDGTRVPSKIENGWFLATWAGGGTGLWTDPKCIYAIEAVAEDGATTTTVESPLGEQASKYAHGG
jgi:hypothetical protein